MIPKTHGRKAAIRTISIGVSLIGLLFIVDGCSLSPISTNSTTTAVAFKGNTPTGKNSAAQTLALQTSTRQTIGSNSSQMRGSSSNTNKPGDLASGGLSTTFHTNVSSRNAKDVSTLQQFANGIDSKNLGYHVYSVVQTNNVLKIGFSTDKSQRNQLLQDCYAISSDLAFSITLHQPLVGVNSVDITASLHGKPVLDYVTPANLMNEWGNNTVSAQYVKAHSQVQVN